MREQVAHLNAHVDPFPVLFPSISMVSCLPSRLLLSSHPSQSIFFFQLVPAVKSLLPQLGFHPARCSFWVVSSSADYANATDCSRLLLKPGVNHNI